MAPDGTGGFRGITIAVSAILMALKNYRSIGKIFIILSRRGAVRRLDIGGPKIFLFFWGSVEQGGAFF